ncbi:hypothetical protein SAVIM40S_01368 [Streptomyces avidinii]
MGAGFDQEGWGDTRSWVEKGLPGAERIDRAVRLRGGWTSQMRRLDLDGGPGGRRSLVLRSFVKPFYLRHAEGLLTREATILRLLGDTDVPAATLRSRRRRPATEAGAVAGLRPQGAARRLQERRLQGHRFQRRKTIGQAAPAARRTA